MSALSEKARSAALDKVERLTRQSPGKVDASGWREPLGEDGDVQTGMRVLSRRAFKRGGKVHGESASARADRKPRKSGGALTADSLINRNVKTANEERDGTKHIGGLKRGGRAHKDMGGLALPAWAAPVSRKSGGRAGKFGGGGMMMRPMPGVPVEQQGMAGGAPAASAPQTFAGRPMMMRAKGGKVHADAAQDKKLIHAMGCKCAKCSGGRVGKAAGGSAIDGGTRPAGGRLARKGGGRTKKGMNVNIIIAPSPPKPAMPAPGMGLPPGAGPVGLHQGAPPPSPGAGAPMGPPAGMPPPQMRKRGGRTGYPIESGAGGGLGRLEKIRAYG
jgi:hypothetical protein